MFRTTSAKSGSEVFKSSTGRVEMSLTAFSCTLSLGTEISALGQGARIKDSTQFAISLIPTHDGSEAEGIVLYAIIYLS